MHTTALLMLPVLMLLTPASARRPYYPLPTPEDAPVLPVGVRHESGVEYNLYRKDTAGKVFSAVSSSSTKSESGDFTASVPIS
ncbi:hypothetical protein FBU59_000696 [Linderina macrospora]|uniref:Uncharacterized protein n=1 Tax=Linderina macrospora TaxID=4868 RepID=A0ACC1JGB8_9FUNG|nr:hypothetical protein FBU59_000696 [Linderina macrospora]